jgi:hypothetical protein
LKIGVGEFEQGGGGAEAVLFQVDEGAGKLNEAFVEGVIDPMAPGQPEFLQDVVRFEVELAVKALEISQVMRVEWLSLKLLDQLRNGAAFFTHFNLLTL